MDYFRQVAPETLWFEYDNTYKFKRSSATGSTDATNAEEYNYFVTLHYYDDKTETLRVQKAVLSALKQEYPDRFRYKSNRCCLLRWIIGNKGDV